ncbi:MAG: LysE family transporter [Saprospiraceae bacterium]
MSSSLLLAPILGLGLSFIGSLPFGIINTTVAETTVRKGLRPGVAMSVGASLVEFFQATLSLFLIDLFVRHSQLERIFNLVALGVFLLLAVYYFFEARKTGQPMGVQVGRFPAMPDFLKGALVSAINVMTFPYWIFYGAYLSANGWMELHTPEILLFSAGTMAGTFLTLLLYAGLGLFLVARASRLTKYINWFLCFLFLGLGGYQVIGLLGY